MTDKKKNCVTLPKYTSREAKGGNEIAQMKKRIVTTLS